MRRYFTGLIIIIALIVLLAVLLSSGPSKPKTQAQILPDYSSTDASVSLTIDGPITADSTHQAVKITVDNSEVAYDQFNGYQGTVANQKTYANNEPAYNEFLWALYRAGFTLGDNDPRLSNEKGVCSLGDRYILELNQNGSDVFRYWTTNCGGVKTFKGSFDLVHQLFIDQVPDYNNLTQNVNL